MIKKETTTKVKLSARGKLIKVDEKGFHIQDLETEQIEIVSPDCFEDFIDKEIKFAFEESSKVAEIVESAEDED